MFLLLVLVLFAVVSTYFGCFILWNKITNYFDSFGHSAIFAASIASLFHISEISSLMIFSFLFSLMLFACTSFNIKLNNTLLIVLSSAFIASGILIEDYHKKIHPHHHDHQIEQKEQMADKLFFKSKASSPHDSLQDDVIEDYVGCIHENESNNFFDFLIGMPLQKWPVKKILTITSLLLGIFCFSLLFAKNWLKNMINKNLYVKKTFDRFAEFVFLALIGFFSIIMVKFSGVLFAVSLSIFPALIAHYFEKGPIQTIIIASLLNIVFTVIAFYIMIKNEGVNFNVILLGLQFIAFIFVSLFKRIRNMAILNSSIPKTINETQKVEPIK